MTLRARTTTARGRVGERIARDFLWAAGHRIVEANARIGHDELDLVTVDPSGALVFAEVRTRSRTHARHPSGLGTLRGPKLARWARAAARWRARHPEFAEARCRFDALAVTLSSPSTVTHVRGVALPASHGASALGSNP